MLYEALIRFEFRSDFSVVKKKNSGTLAVLFRDCLAFRDATKRIAETCNIWRQNEMRHDLLSLFCGAGGLDSGFKSVGFKTVLALDNSTEAVQTFNHNHSGDAGKQADLAQISPESFLRLIPQEANPVGLIGGPPCQGFSQGNVRAVYDDPRNLLPYRYADLLESANRKYKLHFFVFENVVRLAGPRHSNRFKRILSRLRTAGFNVFYERLNAIDYKVPQRRPRLFIVGLNSEIYPETNFEFPLPVKQKQTVRDAISGLPPPEYFDRNLTGDKIPFHPNHWTMVPKSQKFFAATKATGRSFRRLDWNKESPTVAYGHREIHVHPNGSRRLSIFEAMLLQGFPRDYELKGNFSAQVTQVSNAVPPPLAKAIATSLVQLLESVRSAEVRTV